MLTWPIISGLIVLILGIAGLWAYCYQSFLRMGCFLLSVAGVIPLASQFFGLFSGKALEISFASLALSLVFFSLVACNP